MICAFDEVVLAKLASGAVLIKITIEINKFCPSLYGLTKNLARTPTIIPYFLSVHQEYQHWCRPFEHHRSHP